MCEPGFQVMILASTGSVPLPSRTRASSRIPRMSASESRGHTPHEYSRFLDLNRNSKEKPTDTTPTFEMRTLPTRPPVSRMVLPASEGRSASSCFTVIFMSAPTDAFHTPTLVREEAVKSGNVRECKSHVIHWL